MPVLYLVTATTGLYEVCRVRHVAAHPSLEAAEQHRAAAQAQADSLLAQAQARGQGCYVQDVNRLDLALEIFDEYCRYAIEAVAAPQTEEEASNLLKLGAELGQAQAAVERNRMRYDKSYAEMVQQAQKVKARRSSQLVPSPTLQQAPVGTFADKLAGALGR